MKQQKLTHAQKKEICDLFDDDHFIEDIAGCGVEQARYFLDRVGRKRTLAQRMIMNKEREYKYLTDAGIQEMLKNGDSINACARKAGVATRVINAYATSLKSE